jgi:glycosyltransferase involved in cell wall biosynthesis
MSVESRNNHCDLSIVVPVFKVERYIRDCLDSLLHQRFNGSLQILLIDDASPDASGEICTEYANRYKQFQYIRHDRNLGSSQARNTGLEKIRGRYFTFVDPDDILPADALQNLFDMAEKEQADITKGNNAILRRGTQVPANYNVRYLRVFNTGKALEAFFLHDIVRGHPWGKIFRTECFADLRFTPGFTMAQDLLFCAEAFSRAHRFVAFPKTVYVYRLHGEGSTGRKYETGAYLAWLDAVQAVGEFCTNAAQYRSYQTLQVRTLAQIAGEALELQGDILKRVLHEIECRMELWEIETGRLLTSRQSLRSWLRYRRFKKRLRRLYALASAV